MVKVTPFSMQNSKSFLAPAAPKPKITKAMITAVFMADCKISMTLFRCIFSMPVNVAVAAVVSPEAKIVNDATCTSGAISGRLKAVAARKSERTNEIRSSKFVFDALQ